MTPLKNKLALLAMAAGIMAFAAGCGVDSDDSSPESGATGQEAVFVPPEEGESATPQTKATPRTEGEIRIAGQAQGSLTERLQRAYANGGGTADITTSGGNEESAFSDFCAGEVDIVDSARPISPAEYRKCAANGILPVQFQVASDAAVLAIKNETDVGVDCLSFDEVRNIFRAGSPINSWSEVGYDHSVTADAGAPRMKVAGPDEDLSLIHI